jgi:hypothetical protein
MRAADDVAGWERDGFVSVPWADLSAPWDGIVSSLIDRAEAGGAGAGEPLAVMRRGATIAHDCLCMDIAALDELRRLLT